MAATSGSFCISALPAWTLQTFLAGQPILMSISCAPRATLYTAASAICRGSLPAICTAATPSSPPKSLRCRVLAVFLNAGSLCSISPTAQPAPNARHSLRNGLSVMPAIGASAMGVSIVYAPICMEVPPPVKGWKLYNF